jgi:hypothetical protein
MKVRRHTGRPEGRREFDHANIASCTISFSHSLISRPAIAAENLAHFIWNGYKELQLSF